MDRYARLAERIQSVSVFEATPGPFCSFCEWRNHCPEAGDAAAGRWEAEDDETE
jgi:hypothetical protein